MMNTLLATSLALLFGILLGLLTVVLLPYLILHLVWIVWRDHEREVLGAAALPHRSAGGIKCESCDCDASYSSSHWLKDSGGMIVYYWCKMHAPEEAILFDRSVTDTDAWADAWSVYVEE